MIGTELMSASSALLTGYADDLRVTRRATGLRGAVQVTGGLLVAVRPRQWVKNGLVFVPLVFAMHLSNTDLLLRAALTFCLFCALSSAGYLLNDAADVEADRLHPRKRFRPIAAGIVPVQFARIVGVLLGIGGAAGCWAITPSLGVLALAYLMVTAMYTIWLKRIVLLDVFTLSAGFVLRAVAGAVAIAVPISPWLYIATMLGSLLIGLGKRRSELSTLGHGGHRPGLQAYSIEFVDQLILITSGAAVMTYALYSFSADNLPKDHSMMLTIPVVLYGLFRYLFLVRAGDGASAPDDLLFRDRPLLVAVGVWTMLAVGILYASTWA
jgi:4-hydroxybenzoate polyprenyltransferase